MKDCSSTPGYQKLARSDQRSLFEMRLSVGSSRFDVGQQPFDLLLELFSKIIVLFRGGFVCCKTCLSSLRTCPPVLVLYRVRWAWILRRRLFKTATLGSLQVIQIWCQKHCQFWESFFWFVNCPRQVPVGLELALGWGLLELFLYGCMLSVWQRPVQLCAKMRWCSFEQIFALVQFIC